MASCRSWRWSLGFVPGTAAAGCKDQIAVADIVGPGGAAVGLACEWCALARRLLCPLTSQTGSRERAEVPPISANCLDNHEVLILALHGVDLNCFEQAVGRVAKDHCLSAAEIAWEVSDWHTGPVDLAVVSCKE
jgi:hypothetical protein